MSPICRTALCLAAGVLFASGCISNAGSPLERLERRLTFYPVPLSTERPVPEGVQSVWFDGPEPNKLHGILATPGSGPSRALVLYCHGNSANVDWHASRMRKMADQFQVTLFCFDYRGYGRSEGMPSEAGILADARAARAWLANYGGVPEGDIVLMGMSLGGGVAVELAGTDGCRGLILENTFVSLPAVANHHSRILKAGSIMKARLNSVETITNYSGPLLQRHGDADKVIPYLQGEQLFAAAPGPKHFVKHPGGGHNDLPNAEFDLAMDAFFGQL